MKHPEVLTDLLSESLDLALPERGTNIEIIFELDRDSSLLSDLSLKTGISYEVVWNKVDKYSSGTYGSYTINIAESDFQKLKAYLDSVKVEWRIL